MHGVARVFPRTGVVNGTRRRREVGQTHNQKINCWPPSSPGGVGGRNVHGLYGEPLDREDAEQGLRGEMSGWLENKESKRSSDAQPNPKRGASASPRRLRREMPPHP